MRKGLRMVSFMIEYGRLMFYLEVLELGFVFSSFSAANILNFVDTGKNLSAFLLFLVAEHFSQFLFYVLSTQTTGKDGAVGGEEDGVGDGGDAVGAHWC